MILVDRNVPSHCSLLTRFSNWVDPYHTLEQRVSELRTKTLFDSNVSLTLNEKKDLDKVLRLASGWSWPAGRMSKLINLFEPAHLQKFIEELTKECTPIEIEKKLDVYMKALSKDALLTLSEFKTSEVALNRFHSCGIVKNSFRNNYLKKEGKALFKEFLLEGKHFCVHILDIFITLLGINEIGQDKYSKYGDSSQMNEYVADRKLATYAKILGYPAVMFGFIITYVKMTALAYGLTATGLLAAITLLVCYQKYWKPCPKEHSPFKNLTVEMYNPDEPVYPRQDILKQIESAFKERKGVLLVGDKGCGKSSIPKALAQQLDKKQICKFIKNPQVFATGAANFRTSNYDTPDFTSITNRFKKYKDQVIFFFDEFHAFFKTDGYQGSSTTDEIKMFYEDFRYIIGATTNEEYETIIKDMPAIVDRRFKVIHVKRLEDEKIKTVLSQYLQAKYPKVPLGSHVIEHIVERALEDNPKTDKIDAARALLDRAIKEMTNTEFKDEEIKLIHLEDEGRVLEQELLNAENEEIPLFMEKLNAKKDEITKAKAELDKKNHKMERIRKLEAAYLKFKDQSLAMSDAKATLVAGSLKERHWVLLNARMKMLSNIIATARTELKLPKCLDKELVDRLIKK